MKRVNEVELFDDWEDTKKEIRINKMELNKTSCMNAFITRKEVSEGNEKETTKRRENGIEIIEINSNSKEELKENTIRKKK